MAVELLPAKEWRGRNTALHEGLGEDKAGEEPQSKPMPTGKPATPTPLSLSLSSHACWKSIKDIDGN